MSKNTVFVIGAGASFEAGLPTGDQLKLRISKLLDVGAGANDKNSLNGVDKPICEAIYAHVQRNSNSVNAVNRYFHAAKHISKALTLSISIDNFLDEHRDNLDEIPLCGKLAIVRSILEAERKSLLYVSRSMHDKSSTLNFSKLNDTWYISFFKLLTEKCSKNELKERFGKITLIIFNYDRCVEHFIYLALLEKYIGLSKSEAAELVRSIKIYHPYGDVGSLPFSQDGEVRFGGFVDFGEELHSSELLKRSQGIKTFTEGGESRETYEMQNKMEKAERVVFLGFAFHELNMQIIKPEKSNSIPTVECFATGFKCSSHNRSIFADQIKQLYPNCGSPMVTDLTCASLFADYSKSLSF